jgi:hypothetical protein
MKAKEKAGISNKTEEKHVYCDSLVKKLFENNVSA